MTDADWELIQRGSLRFYEMHPEKEIDVFLTTRNLADGGTDHDLGLVKQVETLGLESNLVVMKQSHSTMIERVCTPGGIEADGCFTTESNLALSVRVADCVPIFFWSADSALIGVVHAGWRGTVKKIALRFTEKVEREEGVEPHRLFYSLGPSIGLCCYNVGKEVLDAFSETWPNARDFFTRRRDMTYLDLRAANRFLLNAAGAREGTSLDLCTSCERRRFYSHRSEPGKGRNWGIIIHEDRAS
ncbi:peptidoglycan editing factor PgeF [candidate division WOR-3 bacterium]|nr:peptidoglycan editing factor PgeF [candidate division WOR-3 bacterium]